MMIPEQVLPDGIEFAVIWQKEIILMTTPAPSEKPHGDVATYHRFIAKGKPGPHAYVVLAGMKTYEPKRLLDEIRRGLAITHLERFRANFQLDTDTLAHLLRMTHRTLARRKSQKRLTPQESDRLLAVARLFARALDLFEGDSAAAQRWMRRPQPSLAGMTPLEAAGTEIGTAEVERLIARLEEGVFA
jgi:putative toxin-antitoxin system antitoxin component (TIGR02293 family)